MSLTHGSISKKQHKNFKETSRPDFLTGFDSSVFTLLGKKIVFCLCTLILFMIQLNTSLRCWPKMFVFFHNNLEAFPM